MRVAPASTFLPAAEAGADTLYLASSSFERRCLQFASLLTRSAPNYRADGVELLRYSDRGDVAVRARVQRYYPKLRRLLERIGPVNEQSVEPYAILEAGELFDEMFCALPRGSSVVMDVSTLTKLHVFYAIDSAFRSTRVSTMRVVYSRASYGRYDTLSWGAEEPIILPKFGVARRQPLSKERLLIFCGLEPDRNYSIWRRFGQHGCTMVFVDGGDNDFDRCADRAETLNNFDSKALRMRIPAFSPDIALKIMEDEYERCRADDEYLYIAPMTTKWEILATWEFFRGTSDPRCAAIVYSSPGRLNSRGHTRDEEGECLQAVLWQAR